MAWALVQDYTELGSRTRDLGARRNSFSGPYSFYCGKSRE